MEGIDKKSCHGGRVVFLSLRVHMDIFYACHRRRTGTPPVFLLPINRRRIRAVMVLQAASQICNNYYYLMENPIVLSLVLLNRLSRLLKGYRLPTNALLPFFTTKSVITHSVLRRTSVLRRIVLSYFIFFLELGKNLFMRIHVFYDKNGI